jgi:hypothetical protein
VYLRMVVVPRRCAFGGCETGFQECRLREPYNPYPSILRIRPPSYATLTVFVLVLIPHSPGRQVFRTNPTPCLDLTPSNSNSGGTRGSPPPASKSSKPGRCVVSCWQRWRGEGIVWSGAWICVACRGRIRGVRIVSTARVFVC